MSKNYPIPNLLGGVSKQPDVQRQINESEEQINWINLNNSGLTVRSGSYLKDYINNPINNEEAKYGNYQLSGKTVIDYNNEKILIMFYRFFNVQFFEYLFLFYNINTGEQGEIKFNDENTKNEFIDYLYVNQISNEFDISFLSVNDFTFIYNKNKIITSETSQENFEFRNFFHMIPNKNIPGGTVFRYNIDYTLKSGQQIKSNWNADTTYGYRKWQYFGWKDWGRRRVSGINNLNLREDEAMRFFSSYARTTGFYSSPTYKGFVSSVQAIKRLRPEQALEMPHFLNHYHSPGDIQLRVERPVTFNKNVEIEIVADLIRNGSKYDYERVSFTTGISSGTYTRNIYSNILQLPSGYRKVAAIKEIRMNINNNDFSGFFDIGIRSDSPGYILRNRHNRRTNSTISSLLRFRDTDNLFNYFTPIDIRPTEFDIVINPYKPNNNFLLNSNPEIFEVENIRNINSSRDELKIYSRDTRDINDLPKNFYNNSVFRIHNDDNNPDTDFFLIFKTDGGSEFGYGEYVETFDSKISLKNMPFTLIANENGITIFKGGWFDREVGSDSTNKEPSFVNSTIKDIFIFGNRLCILSDGDKVIMSESGNFFNFWRTSTKTLLPTDRIDITVNTDKNIDLQYAVPWNQGMLLTDNNHQFIIFYDSVLSLDTLQVKELSSFNSDLKFKPIQSNNNLFFISNYGGNTQVTKFFSKDIQLVDGFNTTVNVQNYIPNNIEFFGLNSYNDTMFLSKKNDNKIYVYNYNETNEGLNDSWYTIELEKFNKTNYMFCIKDKLYVLCDSLFYTNAEGPGFDFISEPQYLDFKPKLLEFDLSKNNFFEHKDTKNKHRIHLDEKKIIKNESNIEYYDLKYNEFVNKKIDYKGNGVYTILTDYDYWLFGFYSNTRQRNTFISNELEILTEDYGELKVLNLGEDIGSENNPPYTYGHDFKILTYYGVEFNDPNIKGADSKQYRLVIEIEVPKKKLEDDFGLNYSLEKVLVGRTFNAEYEFTPLVLKDQNNLPLNSGNTQIMGLSLTFGNTGGFILSSEIQGSDTFNELYSSLILNSNNNILGTIPLENGNQTFFIGADRDEVKIKLKNYSYLPAEIKYAEYEYEYESYTDR